MFEQYMVTMDSFGSELPEDWEEIAQEINEQFENWIENNQDATEVDAHDESERLWENYWREH